MSLQIKPPEKKKNSSPPPSFSLLPDEITVNYLARIPRSYYLTLSIVSKSFRSLLSSTELYADRSRLGNTEQCLYVCLCDRFPQWFTLWVNPNRALPNSRTMKKKKKKKKKKKIRQLLVPIPPCNFPSVSDSIVAVSSEIYVIGGPVDGAPSSAVRILDCRSHTWRDAPSMNVARENAVSCVYDGKIYVIGGCKGYKSWAEVFDTKTQTWERLPDPGTEIRKHDILRIKEIEGKIYLDTKHAYDTKQGKWECCENKSVTFPKSQCVIENVFFSCDHYNIDGPFRCRWYDIKARIWREVKGLDSLRDKYGRSLRDKYGRSSVSTSKLVSCGGKLLLIWEGYKKRRKKIRCAEIKLENRDGGEVWGNVEWTDIVHNIPSSCHLLHCLSVSV